METIPVEQIDRSNAKSQNRKYPDITADKLLCNLAPALLS